MTSLYQPCVFCASRDLSLDCQVSIRRALDTDVTKCHGCGLLHANPPPTPEQIAALYDSSYWDPPSIGAREASRRYRRLYRWGAVYGRGLLRSKSKGRMLEIGCGLGFFLKGVAEVSGWEVEGVDAAEGMEAFAREKLGIKVTQGRFEDMQFADAHFDVVRAKDVLEHIPYPMPFLAAIHHLLLPGGTLDLWVPNGPLDLAPARRAYKRGERANMEAGHLLFIAPRVLRRMVVEAGFRVIRSWVFSLRDGLRAHGLWSVRPRSLAIAPPPPVASDQPLSAWEPPPPEAGLRGTMLYAHLRAWRSCHPALPAWIPIGFRQRFLLRKE